MDVPLRYLRYFVAVAEELHFTRAAERLYISQPSLSNQIRQLERDLGCALFERDHRSVYLTAAGEALVGPARTVLADWDTGLVGVRRAANQEARALRVGFHTSVAGSLYKKATELFTADHGGWHIALKLHHWSDATAGLSDGSSDVAYLWLPVPDQDRLAWHVLRSEPRYVAMRPDHRLAARTAVEMEDLLDEPFIALPPSAGVLRDYWLALDQRHGHPVRIGAEVESPDATFEAIAAGQGIVLLAQGNAELYTRPDIVARPVIDLSHCDLAVVWAADDTRPVVKDLAKAAARAAGTGSLMSSPASSPRSRDTR
jgi:DNA-binding transcriptional LysR family regulator